MKDLNIMEALDILEQNGYHVIDEGKLTSLLDPKHRFASAVISKLKKFGYDITGRENEIIRHALRWMEYGFDPVDCFQGIRGNFKHVPGYVEDNYVNEDFGIGVGGAAGLDQGIPHGGDCKGCYAKRVGLYQRSPYTKNPLYHGVTDAHHHRYWLNQIPKKKRRKKLHRKKTVNENFLTNLFKKKTIISPDEGKKILMEHALNYIKQYVLPDDPNAVKKFLLAYDECKTSFTRFTNAKQVSLSDAKDLSYTFGRYVARFITIFSHDDNINNLTQKIIKSYLSELDSVWRCMVSSHLTLKNGNGMNYHYSDLDY